MSPYATVTAPDRAPAARAAAVTDPPRATRLRWRAGHHAVAGIVAVQARALDPVALTLSGRGRRDPRGTAEAIRRRGRVVVGPLGAVTADHGVADLVLRDHRRFGSAVVSAAGASWASRALVQLLGDTSAMGQGRPRPAWIARSRPMPPDPLGDRSMIGMNPPDHTRLRRLVSRAFSPRAVETLRPVVEAMADDLLDRMAARRGTVDLVTDYADRLPVAVMAGLFGVPPPDHDRVLAWGHALALGLDVVTPPQLATLDRARQELAVYLAGLFAERRARPGDLVVDTLLAADDTGAVLDDDELLAMSTLLLTAGFETTVNHIGNTLSALLLHPRQRRVLAEDPGLLANALEEGLRWDPPVQRDNRYVREATVLAGVPLAPGQGLLVLVDGANRDPAVFDRPEVFDVTRANASRHLSFGVGVHHCLGSSLARMEGEVAVGRLLARFPHLRAAGPGRRNRRVVLRGFEHLPVELGPEAA